MLNQRQAVEQTRDMLRFREQESERLDKIHAYLRGMQTSVPLPSGVPREVKRLAYVSKVNVCSLVVDTVAQQLFVDGYRGQTESDDEPVWSVWQRNQLDMRQTGIHRAALAYGAAYTVVLPGEPVPVIRGVSPRRMTVVYGDDPMWPVWALEQTRGGTFKLYDDEAVYEVAKRDGEWTQVTDPKAHDRGVPPVVRYLNVADLDDDVVGEVEVLFDLQDQINITTFGLLVAQHYGAFRQRYILGWLAETEEQKLKASASRLWTFADDESSIKVGEFEQTDLSGYLESREAALRHMATVSQTPPHHLLGQLANLSAEALAAAEAGQQRKIAERKVVLGEAHEQTLGLAAQISGDPVDEAAQVRWRDTEARALSSTVDALGKMAQMLGIPPQALWERVPGVTQRDVERWEGLAASGDALGNLTALLDSQAQPAGDATDLKAKFDALGAAVRAGATFESAAAQLGLSGLVSSGAVPVSLRLPESDAERLETT